VPGGTQGGTGGGAGGGAPAGCSACDDGSGGMLQDVGEDCAVSSNCCAGLTCVGASASSMGTCVGTLQCAQPQGPNWQGLTTAKLRQIAIANKINGCDQQTGVNQNRTIGIAFEAWVLKVMGLLQKRWTMPIMSMARQKANTGNGGLPASVIPEYVGSQARITLSAPLTVTWTYFTNSLFYEVKAVGGALTPGTSQWQILGLLDVATTFPTVPSGSHAPPAVIFITTSNTTVSTGVVTQALMWNVAVWQLKVFYDANSATPNDPLLQIGSAKCLTPTLYPASSTPGTLASLFVLDTDASSWPDYPLTWPTVAEQNSVVVPGDPDSPAVVN
jgi:hypothetical protein